MVETLESPDLSVEQSDERDAFTHELEAILTQGHHERAQQRAQEIQKPQPDDVEGFSRFWGIQDPEFAQTIIEQAQERQPFVRIAHRISRENLQQLIDADGTLKSVFETGITKGGSRTNVESYKLQRRAYEEKYGLRTGDDRELIHGFLEDIDYLGEQDIAESYGAVEIVFNESVTNRSVFTAGDSLQNDEPPTDMMSALRSRELQGYRRQTGENNSYRTYAEALIIDEVGLGDAEAMVFDDITSDTLDSTLQLVDGLHKQYPDILYTLRIDARDTVYLKKLLSLVSEKPYVNIVLALEIKSSPFLRSRVESENHEAMSNIYDDAIARRDQLDAKLQQRWAEMGNQDQPLPEGIKTAIILKGASKS